MSLHQSKEYTSCIGCACSHNSSLADVCSHASAYELHTCLQAALERSCTRYQEHAKYHRTSLKNSQAT